MKLKKYFLFALVFSSGTGFSSGNEIFKTEFLTYLGHNENVDFSDEIKPGKHFVLVYVNGKKVGTEFIDFKLSKNNIIPCFTRNNLSKFNLNYNNLNLDSVKFSDCSFIDNFIKGAYATLDMDDERLDINIPQIYLSSEPEDYIYPSQWDRGVNSYALKYNMNATGIREKKSDNAYYYNGYFEQHLNFYSWHIYTSNSLNARNDSSIKNKFYDLYAEHAIASLKSKLTVGEINTNSEYFNWVKYKGVRLSSDDRMNASSLSGFAPLIRGIANSPSLLTIKYNDRVIYERNIPAGEYNIQDIPRTFGNGYLAVILTGADGSKKVQEIPITTIANLIRPGNYEYSLNLGSLDSMYPGNYWITQGDIKYGINNNLTVYSGLQSIFPNDYSLAMIGGTFNTIIGGVSLDYYRSFSNEKNNHASSCDLFCQDKIVLNYEEDLSFIDTNFSMSFTRYLDENYLDLNNYMSNKYGNDFNQGFNSSKYKQVSNATLKKTLPNNYGGVSASGYYARSWNSQGKDSYSYSFGYSNNINKLNYNVSFFTYRNNNDDLDNTFFISFDLPLETKNKNINLSSSYVNYADSYNTRVSLSVNDKSFDNINYSMWADRGTLNNLGYGASMNYNNGYNSIEVGYSQNDNSNMIYGNLNGAIVLHQGGITRASDLGKTFAIVKAIGAEGMKVSTNSNIKINGNGYGVVPYLSPYRKNYITLDSKKSKNMAEIDDNRLLVIPDSGSSPLVEFKIKKINRNILKISSSNYEIPFGAQVVDYQNNLLGITDQSGFVLLPQNNNENKRFSVIWNIDNKENTCHFELTDVPESSDSIINVNCT
ncbi:fimbria/pilus outer membrane usher protein [Providencia sp. PROV104]|uniref:fimbria/pilus outer membrane usher protein n=1 Tax=Providencia sp. PROV104 TaxID=2949816 RepID=UPI00234B823D|nr:fimbria/pilus outer membrane usher protein [Providencia sp. PROV104]